MLFTKAQRREPISESLVSNAIMNNIIKVNQVKFCNMPKALDYFLYFRFEFTNLSKLPFR